MSIVHRLRKEIAEREDLILEIQKECHHPPSGRTVRPISVSRREYEDGDDGYVGDMVNRIYAGTHISCGLCCKEWNEVDGKVWTGR